MNLNCWSNLSLDLTKLIFDRFGFADFSRAKSVCSSWRSGSRQSQPNNQIPWMISFPRDQNHCLLFNPKEKEKLYKSRDFDDDFAKSVCVMTQGNWLLMLDPTYGGYRKSKYKEKICEYNLYILHLIGERINLPSLEAEFWFSPPILIFWIDEKTKDYLIIQMPNEETSVSLKKRDNSWKTIPHLSLLGIMWPSNLLYKDHKLYCLIDYKFKVFDFSGDIPLLVFKISVDGCIRRRAVGLLRMSPSRPLEIQMPYSKKNVVVTLSGDILIVSGRACGYSVEDEQ